jgi:hypothetical protein
MNSMGELLLKQGDFDGAVAYLRQGILIAAQLDLKQDIRIMYSNMALALSAQQQFDSAQVYMQKYAGLSSASVSKSENDNPETGALQDIENQRMHFKINYLAIGLAISIFLILVWLFSEQKRRR